MQYRIRVRAYTLYELLITMTLVALVLTMGIPSFGGVVGSALTFHLLSPGAGRAAVPPRRSIAAAA